MAPHDEAADLAHLVRAQPRVVSAGVPMRMPEVDVGRTRSKGMVFLLTVMPAASSSLLGLACPVTPALRDVDEHQVVVGAAGHHA